MARRALGCDDLQLLHWRCSPIRIHASEIDQRWLKVEAEADVFVARVWRVTRAARVARVCWQLAQCWHYDYGRRQQMRRQVNRRWRRVQKRVVRAMRIRWSRAAKLVRRTVRMTVFKSRRG